MMNSALSSSSSLFSSSPSPRHYTSTSSSTPRPSEPEQDKNVGAASSSTTSSSTTSASLKWLDFEDAEAAFKNRTTWELVRAWSVFHVCGWTPLVRRARRLLSLAEALVGARAVSWLLRRTFFAHFCAGETQAELLPVIDRLRAAGVGAILDYAAEADLPPAPGANGNATKVAAGAGATPSTDATPFPYPSTPAGPTGPPPPAEFFRV
jgi:proline dehydrogenase